MDIGLCCRPGEGDFSEAIHQALRGDFCSGRAAFFPRFINLAAGIDLKDKGQRPAEAGQAFAADQFFQGFFQ